MNRTRIRYFLNLAESLNFSDTARAFSVSQPALSKAIKRLEDELGGKLIRREGRLTHLTPMGRVMQDKLQDVENASRTAELAAKRLARDGMQRLNIAIMCTVSPKRIVPFLTQVRRNHPNLEFVLDDVTSDRIVEMVLSGHCDLALVANPFDSSQRMRQVDLYRESMVVATGLRHRFAGRQTVELSDLAKEHYVDRLNCEFRGTFNKAFSGAELMLDVVLSSGREDWVHDSVASDLGVSIMPEDSVDHNRHSFCKLGPEPYWRTVSLMVATGREDNDAVRSVVKAARSYQW